MFLSPAIMALMLVSALVCLMMLVSAVFSVQLVRHWDISSGSEQQLVLERRTYLISTLLSWVFAAELLSLLLFIYNAESMSGQFVGAMCATGVLNANVWGWPTLFLKMVIFFAGAGWLVLNYLDNQGYDYPLVRIKYIAIVVLTPVILAEGIVQTLYFSGLNPDVITSCCGSLFSSDAEGVAAEVASLEPRSAMLLLYTSGLVTLVSGIWVKRKKRFEWIFSLAGTVTFVIALVAVVSFIALYVYEHPHHHCPFCILKSGHGYVGYLLYIPLFLATSAAIATGIVAPWKKTISLTESVSVLTPKLTQLALLMFVLFFMVSTWVVIRSNLSMAGVWW